jgi:S1-C subfamily serine protease
MFCLLASTVQAQDNRPPRLASDRFKNGATTRRAFVPVAAAARESIVEFDLDGETVALGAIIDTNGLAITKASEVKEGKLTGKLADGTEVDARVVAVNEDNDVALVKLGVNGAKPLEWAVDEVAVGQWAVSPGVEVTPEAVGIVSVPPRKILHPRALIGVMLDYEASGARIREVMPEMGAEKVGLKPGDVILQVNDQPVKNSEELTGALRRFREGQTVKLRARREEQEFDASVQMMVPKPGRTGRELDRQERMNRLGGDVSQRAEGFGLAIQHDTVLPTRYPPPL